MKFFGRDGNSRGKKQVNQIEQDTLSSAVGEFLSQISPCLNYTILPFEHGTSKFRNPAESVNPAELVVGGNTVVISYGLPYVIAGYASILTEQNDGKIKLWKFKTTNELEEEDGYAKLEEKLRSSEDYEIMPRAMRKQIVQFNALLKTPEFHKRKMKFQTNETSLGLEEISRMDEGFIYINSSNYTFVRRFTKRDNELILGQELTFMEGLFSVTSYSEETFNACSGQTDFYWFWVSGKSQNSAWDSCLSAKHGYLPVGSVEVNLGSSSIYFHIPEGFNRREHIGVLEKNHEPAINAVFKKIELINDAKNCLKEYGMGNLEEGINTLQKKYLLKESKKN